MKTNPLPRRRGFAASRWIALGASLFQAIVGNGQATTCEVPASLVPPPTGSFHFTGTLGAPGPVQLKDLELLLPDTVEPPPAPGTSGTVNTNFVALGRVSTNGGASFSPFRGTAVTALRLTAGSPGEPFDTEMLMLNLELPAGPSGQPTLLRESPTQASKGPTSIRQMPAGNWQMDSFFDIFTEISDDGGTTWIPETPAHRATLHSCPPEGTFSSSDLPAPTGLHRALEPVQFQTAAGLVRLRHLVIFEPTDPAPPPPAGGSVTVSTSIKVQGEWAVDGGVFSPFSTTAAAHIQITHHTEDGAVFFDTEMLALDVSGGGLPGGMLIRESPTLPSRGKTSLRPAGGKSHISSFFDVFTELSLDGGQSWHAARGGTCRVVQDGDRHGHFFPTGCFPQGGDYASGQGNSVAFPGSAVVLRGLRHRPATQPQPPPDPGMATTQALDGMLEYELSLDGGSTFTRHREYGGFECFPIRWHEAPVPGDTEMSLECCALTVGSLRLRESPTLPSRGQHRIRPTSDGYLVDSFFDIFTEISLDGGVSWLPAGAPLRCDLAPYVEQDLAFRSDFMPPRDGSFEMRKLADSVRFRSTGIPLNSIRNMKLREFSSSYPPNPCDDQIAILTASASFEWSTDDGQTWTQHTADCALTMVSRRTAIPGSTGLFDTEMLAMDLSGGSLPAGMQLRESPSRPSKGRTSIAARLMEEEGIYDYAIDSFFDIFTELSIDGGTHWTPADDACHLELHAKPEGPLAPSNWLPLAVQYRETDFNFAISFGAQAEIRGLRAECQSPLCTADRAPAPVPGSSLTRTMTTPFACEVSLDGGTTHHRASGSAILTLAYSDMSTDGGGWTVLTSEILQFDAALTGTGLPGGVMIRESPTKASLGRTSYRPAGAAYRIDSFFDIFTELSIDGGTTWTPACKPIRLEALPAAGKGVKQAIGDKILAGTFSGGSAKYTPRCTTGQHIKNAGLLVRKQGTDQHDFLVPLPSPAMVSTASLDATLQLEYSPDGITFTRIEAPVYFRFEMKEVMVDSIQWSCTNEVTVFDASGGTFPSGMLVREKRRPGRESPTLRSVGRTTSTPLPGDQFQIDSFFDIFTELSVDGGNSWHEFDLPLHLELQHPNVEGTAPATPWPPPGNLRTLPGDPDFDLLFANGSSCGFFDIFTEFFGPGSLPFEGLTSTNISFPAVATLDLTVPGSTVGRVTCPAIIDTVVTRNQPVASDGTWHFDTEMLALDLTSGLPPNIRVRESPTKASLGRTTLRPTSDGSGSFIIDSFFDIFVELSTDGGATWSAADQAVRVVYAKPHLVVYGTGGSDTLTTVFFPPRMVDEGDVFLIEIGNLGQADLTVTGLTLGGADASQFGFTPPASPVAPGGHSPLTVTFAPDSPGQKTAMLVIATSDPDHPSITIELTGRAYAPGADDDGDGVTNQQELAHGGCGFDPAVSNPDLLEQLRNHGFYRASDMHSLALGRPLLARDPATGSFHLSLGVLKSDNLAGWTPLLGFTPTHDPATGLLDLEIEPDGSDAEFYQVFGSGP